MLSLTQDHVRAPQVPFEQIELEAAGQSGLVIEKSGSFFGPYGQVLYIQVKDVARRQAQSFCLMLQTSIAADEPPVRRPRVTRPQTFKLVHLGKARPLPYPSSDE